MFWGTSLKSYNILNQNKDKEEASDLLHVSNATLDRNANNEKTYVEIE